MQRQFSVVSLFTSLISFAAATLICVQLQQANFSFAWKTPVALVWTLESAVYAMVIYGWQPGVSPIGWAVAVIGLLLIRNVIGLASGLIVGVSGHPAGEAIAAALSLLPVRACGTVFAIMIAYPLRLLLPCRSRVSRVSLRESKQQTPDAAARSTFLLIGDRNGQPTRDGLNSNDANPNAQLLVTEIAGIVAVPLGALLPQLPPQEEVQATVQGLDPDFPVEVPLKLVVPQLREARLLVSGPDLAQLLPTGGAWEAFSAYLEAASATSFLLPLPVVVPQLPPEVLACPPGPLPAWARVEEDPEEKLLFALV